MKAPIRPACRGLSRCSRGGVRDAGRRARAPARTLRGPAGFGERDVPRHRTDRGAAIRDRGRWRTTCRWAARLPDGRPDAASRRPGARPARRNDAAAAQPGPRHGLARSLAIVAATPAVEGVVLAADALLDLGAPLWSGAAFTAMLLGRSDIPDLTLEPPRDPVRSYRRRPPRPRWRGCGSKAPKPCDRRGRRRRRRAGPESPCGPTPLGVREQTQRPPTRRA